MVIDSTGCLGSTIKVASGHYVDILNPKWQDIDIQTIASALSKICRFGGHCPRFYSVAEHCVHATNQAMSDGVSGDEIVAILLHDAAEAYLGDVVKPLKNIVHPYIPIEAKMERAIGSKYGVDFTEFNETIKKYDHLMLKCEKIYFWPEDKNEWSGFGGVEARDIPFKCFDPVDAEIEFLKLAEKLGLSTHLSAPQTTRHGNNSKDILEEALELTSGARISQYGPPDQDFRRTAGMWTSLFGDMLKDGVKFEPFHVAQAMILLKMSRQLHQRKRDNWVDTAGYARCGSICDQVSSEA